MSEIQNRVLVAINRADGGVSIMAIVTDATGTATSAQVDAAITQWMTSLDQDTRAAWTPIQGWRPISREEIPVDREYRGALMDHPTDGLTHHVGKAKVVALARVREMRDVALAQLDVQWMKAVGRNDQAAVETIEAQRQVLRDKPQVLTAALETSHSIAEIHAHVTRLI